MYENVDSNPNLNKRFDAYEVLFKIEIENTD